jgi:hypothetical protein
VNPGADNRLRPVDIGMMFGYDRRTAGPVSVDEAYRQAATRVSIVHNDLEISTRSG